MARSHLTIMGRVDVLLFDTQGNVVQRVQGNNLVTDAGLNLLLQRLANDDAGGPSTNINPVSYMAVGTNTATPVHTDTDIGTELGVRKPVTAAWNATGELTFTANWGNTEAVGTISAVGLWTDATSGVLFSHFLLPTSLIKTAFAPLQVAYTVTVQAV